MTKDRRVYRLLHPGNRTRGEVLEASGPDDLTQALVRAGVDAEKARVRAEALWSDEGVRYQADNITIRHIGYMRYTEVNAAPAGPKTEETAPKEVTDVLKPRRKIAVAEPTEQTQTLMSFIEGETH